MSFQTLFWHDTLLDNVPEDFESLLVAGWGVIRDHRDDAKKVVSDVLRKTEIKPISHGECYDIYEKSNNRIMLKTFTVHDEDSVICVFDDNGKDSCQGDSGGPLFKRFAEGYVIFGLVSYGPNELCGKYSVQYFVYQFQCKINKSLQIF